VCADDAETVAALALAALSRRGTRGWIDAMARLGGAAAVLAASDVDLAALGIAPRALARRRSCGALARARELLASCRDRGIRVAVYGGADYPTLLMPIGDPPIALYWRGAVAPAAVTPAVAIVGARRATRYGLRCAREFGQSVAAAGAWVVSGLAHGIDAAAQTPAAALGRTAAVLAGGVDRCYPASNRRLADRILESGVVLSEYPPGTPTLARQFPVRNRIITGMAMATLIVESHARGGSLVSARHAADQGRDVFAVPGPIDSPASAGTNRLLADGCGPALGPDELLAAIGVVASPVRARAGQAHGEDSLAPLDGVEAAIFHALDIEPSTVDDLVAATGLDESVVLEKLTTLELDGLAERLPEGAYVRRPRPSDATEHS
jgi:DNA processing protein